MEEDSRSSVSQPSGPNKKRNQAMGSVDAFWEDFPRLHMAKQAFDGVIELYFLIAGSMVIRQDKGKVCEDTKYNETFNIERLRFSINLMMFIHVLHLCRLFFAFYNKYSKKSAGAFKGCLRCLLVDCYCCAGTAVYLYTQISFFLDWKECRTELPNLKSHMRHEVIY